MVDCYKPAIDRLLIGIQYIHFSQPLYYPQFSRLLPRVNYNRIVAEQNLIGLKISNERQVFRLQIKRH